MRLKGRIALVTGSGRGLGEAQALRLASEGADVVINDLIMENAQAVCEKIRAMGRRSIAVYGDVSNSTDVDKMFERVIAEFGHLDILVNNAGCTQHVSVHDMTDQDWDRIVRVNLYGPFYCSRAAIRYMIPRQYGKIVNISSVSAKRGGGVWGAAHYSAAKAGVIGFTKALAREVAQYNITVNAVAPGIIRIPLQDDKRLAAKEAAAQQVPMGRQGRPDEIAAAVAFLASDDSSYITGEIMDVNGGYYMD